MRVLYKLRIIIRRKKVKEVSLINRHLNSLPRNTIRSKAMRFQAQLTKATNKWQTPPHQQPFSR